MLFGAVMMSVWLQEMNVLLELGDNKLMGGETRARQPPHFFSRRGPGPQLSSLDEKETRRKQSALWIGIETMQCIKFSFN